METDRQRQTDTYRQRKRQTDRQIDRQRDRKTDTVLSRTVRGNPQNYSQIYSAMTRIELCLLAKEFHSPPAKSIYSPKGLEFG